MIIANSLCARLIQIGILLFLSCMVHAADGGYDYQRYITFKNDFPFTIYPVIQVPENNCVADSKRVRRIIVNGSGHKGLETGEHITVLIPDDIALVTKKEVGEESTFYENCWYRAGRIYIFGVNLGNFEAAMDKKVPGNGQGTLIPDPNHPEIYINKQAKCFMGLRQEEATAPSGKCDTGGANATFAADVPAQLAEYTFDADLPMAEIAFENERPKFDTGIPMADIDVSNVDDIYLPIAASVYNHGATGFMGSAMNLTDFKKRVRDFYSYRHPATKKQRWTTYSAYQNNYWNGANSTFSPIAPDALGGKQGVDIALHLPAGYNLVNNSLGGPRSSVYIRPNYPGKNFQIQGVQESMNDDTQVITRTNPIMKQYLDRWMYWVNRNPCTKIDSFVESDWPDGLGGTDNKFDKQNFCNKFKLAVDDVWKHFKDDPVDGYNGKKLRFMQDCGLYDPDRKYQDGPNKDKPIPPPNDLNSINACILQHIVGYNSDVLGGHLPGEVQAILRGVAYEPNGNGIQYQYDPFLTFTVPYESKFNLDPFTRLIHNPNDGVDAVAYSFSIDDKYGNFRDISSGFIIDAGGVADLENQRPYDPYQQYRAVWGYNPNEYTMAKLSEGLDIETLKDQLITLGKQKNGLPLLVKQLGSNPVLWVVGDTQLKGWQVFRAASEKDLDSMINQQSIGKEDRKQLVELKERMFGAKDVFPGQPLDLGNPQSDQFKSLLWDQEPEWNLSKLKLYAIIDQGGRQAGNLKVLSNNWVKGSFCGKTVEITGAGSMSLVIPYVNGAYQGCDIQLYDSKNRKLVFRVTPQNQEVEDQYTGLKHTVWTLPHDNTPNDNQISSPLTTADKNYCMKNSTNLLRYKDKCNASVSANWSDDPAARDVIYMGLNQQDMPRVNFSLGTALKDSDFDPDQPYWPFNPKFTAVAVTEKRVKVSWPKAIIERTPRPQISYKLDFGERGLRTDCTPIAEGNRFSCEIDLDPDTSPPYRMQLTAINDVTPGKQSTNLVGCFPAKAKCN